MCCRLFYYIKRLFLSSSNKRDISKVLNLYLVAALFRVLLYSAGSIIKGTFTFSGFLGSLNVGNYFLLLYSAVYILSPYINIVFNNITKKSFVQLLTFMTILFSIYPTVIEYLFQRDEALMGYSFVSFFDGDGHGYTLVNFMFMYTIGVYLNKYGMIFNKKHYCFMIYSITSVLMAVVMHCVQKVELNYFSPICIISAVALFNYFALVKPSENKVVNYLSSTVFGIFIVHGLFISLCDKIIKIESIVNLSPMLRVGGILLFALSVFVLSILMSIVLNVIIDKIFMPCISRVKVLSYEVKLKYIWQIFHSCP